MPWEDAGDVLTVDVTGLTNRTDYTFEVRAVNLAGPGEAAPKTQSPSSKPSAPRNVTATGGNGIITLSWDEPADNGGTAIVSYLLQEWDSTANSGNGAWGPLGSTAASPYIDSNVAAGVTSDYRVRALNANTNDPSDWATASGVAQGLQVPSAPQKLEATSSNKNITYSWEEPANIGGTAITRYEYRQMESAPKPRLLLGPVPACEPTQLGRISTRPQCMISKFGQ